NYIDCVGADESGKGDVFGPIVVGIVYIRNEVVDFLLRNNVQDSRASACLDDPMPCKPDLIRHMSFLEPIPYIRLLWLPPTTFSVQI
ncbi:MAG: hypothetical protein Q8834_02770, partial [Candidatus Phytoplasma australasiaticum]|nr:hypothetical protein [Candidatus Phytoplasma australasiaticum]